MAESLSFVGKVTGIEESVANAWRAVERKRYQLKPQLDSSRFGINGLTSDVNKFEKSLAFATNRVAGFAAAASVFYAIQRSFKAFVTTTIEVENSLARINVNLNRNSSGLKEFSHTLFNIARETGAAFSDVAKSAEEFARQGLSVAETAKRTRDALVLSRIAAIGAAEATQDLTAAVNTFYKEALTTTDIVNRLAAVDTRFAVSSRDLGLAISRVGNSAQEAGVSFNQLLGIVTAVQQTTQRGGSVIGNSLKTIFTRIARPEVLDQLQQLGVATRDTNNQFLPAIDIIRNLAGRYDNLSQSQKSVLAEQVGGVYQINILKAAVADLNKQYSTYTQVVQVAGNAQNEAFEKNAQLNKTLQASLAATGNSIKELFATVGNQRASGLIKIVTDGIEGLRKYLSGDSGSELGQLLGDGIVKGLSNVLTGPALVASAFAIGRTLFKVFSGFAQNFRAELGLATVAEKRELVLRRINTVMQQANLEEQKQIASASGLLAQKEAILRVAERIAVTEARQTASNIALAGSFVSPGARAKVDPRLFKRAAEGYVPAVGAEQAAISQGVGGASPSAKPVVIPNFAFGGGKRGPLVANTSEYIVPNFANGGSAIFNPAMVRAYGLPAGARKINAAEGHVPNFAAGFRGTAGNSEILQYLRRGSASSPQFGGMYFAGADTRFAGAQGAGAAALFAMAQKAQGGSPVLGKQGYVLGVNPASYEKAQLGYMAKGGLAAKEIETIQRLNYTSGGDLKMGAPRDFGRFSKLFSALFGNAAGGFVPNLSAAISREVSAGVSPSSIYVDTDARVRSSGNPMGLLVANRRDEPAGGFQGVNRVLSQGGNPRIAGAARGLVPNFADFGPGDLRLRAGTVGNFGGGFFVQPDQVNNLNKLFESVRKAGSTDAAARFGVQIQDFAATLDKTSQKGVLKKLAREFDAFFYKDRVIASGRSSTKYGNEAGPDYSAFDRLATPRNPARLEALRQKNLREGDELTERFYSSTNRPRRTRTTVPTGPSFGQRAGEFLRNPAVGIGISIGAPLAAGFIPEGKGGTLAGGVAGGASGALQGAGIGAIFGPVGIAVGSVVGALVGSLSKLKKSVEEFGDELDKGIEAPRKSAEAFQRASSILDSLDAAQKSGAAPDVIKRLSDQYSEARGQIGDKGLSGALGKSSDERGKIANQALADLDQRQRSIDAAKALRGIQGGTFGNTAASLGSKDITSAIGSLSQAFSPDQAKSLNLDRLRTIAGTQGSGVDYPEIVKRVKEVQTTLGQINPAFKDIQVGVGDFSQIAYVLFQSAIKARENFQRVNEDLKKVTQQRIGLGANAFLAPGDSNTFRQFALTGRGRDGVLPRNRYQQAQSTFDTLGQLVSSGATADLNDDPTYRRARGLTQRGNVLSTAADFLKARNPGTRYQDERGNFFEQSITSSIRGLERNPNQDISTVARLLSSALEKSSNTLLNLKDAGISLNNGTGGSRFGVENGVGVSTYAGSRDNSIRAELEQAQKFVTDTLSKASAVAVKTTLQLDGTVKVISDTLSAEKLSELSKTLTDTIGKNFQAEIRDINQRISKLEGTPMPPTTRPSSAPIAPSAPFGNQLYRGSDGFIRSKP